MSQVIKMYMGLFFLLMEALVGMGIITAGIKTMAARDYHADILNEIECSNFNPGVMEACRKQAEKAGYQVEIEPVVYDEDRNVQMASVILKYEYAIDALQLAASREIRGTAR